MFLPPALVILAAGGWLIAQRALRPVAGITSTAQRITARGLDQRVPEGKADSELLNLIRTINSMLDRLERSFNQAVRFSADAAHELQTPLTVLQGMLDDAVRQCPREGEEQRRYASLLEEVQRLKAIVQKLLILARADASQLPLRREPVDFSELIQNAVDDATVLKPDARIEAHIAPGVILQGDRDLLGLVVQELTKNAAKYNRESGVIRYELATESTVVRLTVENSSDPIPVEDRERIFERFHRVDKSRSVRVPGTGLGLSLAREITRAHRGTLRLDPAKPGLVGFSLRLPLQQ
jgi:signal transduction histidine kinase